MFNRKCFTTKCAKFPTDWCYTDHGVPSDGQKVVYVESFDEIKKPHWLHAKGFLLLLILLILQIREMGVFKSIQT